MEVMRVKENILKLLVVFVPYTGMYSIIPEGGLTTWRLINMVVVLVYMVFFRLVVDLSLKLFFSFVALYMLMFLVQQMAALEKVGSYSVIFILGMVTLFLMVAVIYSSLKHKVEVVNGALAWSIFLIVAYQIYQAVVYFAGYPEFATVLNDKGLLEDANFFRIVGGWFGPPGFMIESGHLALFVGPALMYLLICQFYGISKVPGGLQAVTFLGLVLSLSGGAIVQIAFWTFLQLLFLLVRGAGNPNEAGGNQKVVKSLLVVVAAVAVFVALVGEFVELILYKISSVMLGVGVRAEGASEMMSMFWSSPYFGSGINIHDMRGVDTNTFFPYLWSTHGVFFGISFILLLFVPIALLFVMSSRKIFVVPFLAQFAHVMFAYGSYVWPSFWIVYASSMFGLSTGVISSRRFVSESRLPFLPCS